MEVIDGYTVERQDDFVRLTFSNRYGESVSFLFPAEDIRALVQGLEELGVL